MRRILLTLALLLVAASAFAQQPSVTFMPLAVSPQFQNRVQYLIAQDSPVIQVEAVAYTPAGGDTHAATPACHSLRANLAASIARSPASFSAVFAVHLAGNINVTTAGALTGSGNTLDTPATDAALIAAVAGLWSTIAGCITNP